MELLQDSHVWFAISFAVFVGLAWHLGKDAVLNALDARINEIRKDIETSEPLRIEAQEMLAQYQRKHRDAMQDAEKISLLKNEALKSSRLGSMETDMIILAIARMLVGENIGKPIKK